MPRTNTAFMVHSRKDVPSYFWSLATAPAFSQPRKPSNQVRRLGDSIDRHDYVWLMDRSQVFGLTRLVDARLPLDRIGQESLIWLVAFEARCEFLRAEISLK